MARRQARSETPTIALGRDERCEAIYSATLAISTRLSLDEALQRIADEARTLVKARYAALGVLDEERRRLTRFIVSGLTQEQIRRIDHRPRGLGLLGELIHFPRPLRVKDISTDPRAVGFPPRHPRMTSFLGVPIIRGERVLGNFYMTEEQGAEEFSQEDQEVLALFAAHAAIAIENARLYTETDIRLKEKVVEVERAERRARFLAELGALLLQLPAGEQLPLESMARWSVEPLGDAAALYLVDPDNPRRVIASALFHQVPARRRIARDVLQVSWETLSETVISRGEPVLVQGISESEQPQGFGPDQMERGRFSAALAVPIATRQRSYGLFASLASRPLSFSEEDLRFARLIADRLGSALDAGRAYRMELEARERVQQMAQLAQHRASELETVLDTMAEAVYVVDTRMRLVRLNRAYARLVGLGGTREIVGSILEHVRALKPREESGRLLAPDELPSARALRGEVFSNQLVVVTPIGTDGDSYLSVSGAPIRDPSGEIVAAVNVARDVTEIKEVDRLKDEFISVASHELRTPLTVIKGFTQILLQRLETLPERASEAHMARRILDQSDRMAGLAERLLDVSRVQFGRLQLEIQEVDLGGLVTEITEGMRMSVRDHTIHLTAEQPLPARVDPRRIEQVLSNLISNAAKYSPSGTRIEVGLERRDGQALLSVRDHGYGVPREQQPRLFQRFYRARSAAGKAGLGLGLYVSKGIVEAHGGRIWFESREGEGTTFYALVPAEAGDRPEVGEVAGQPGAAHLPE